MTGQSTTSADSEFLRKALALAEGGRGRVSPNPLVGAVIVRYSLVLSSTASISVTAGLAVLLPAAGLTAAATVPNTIYSPLFRKLVEWVEYLCLMPIFPLALWLMNVYAAIRYR